MTPQRYSKRGRPTSGSLRAHKSKEGIWTYAVRYQIHGKRRQKVVARGKNKAKVKKIAERELARMRRLWETDRFEDTSTYYKEWDEAIRDFLAWCKQHLERKSWERYRNVMNNWREAGLYPELLDDTTGLEFEKYKGLLLADGREPSGVNFEIETLKTLWNWCRRSPRGWVSHDPFEGIVPLRTGKGPDTMPRIFTPKECTQIRAIAPDFVRDVFDFAIFTGLRLGELVYLDPEDIDTERRTARVVSKPGHRVKDKEARLVPLSVKALAIAEENAEARPKGPLFIGPRTRGKRWRKAGDSINRYIKKVAPDASIKTARATFISYALRDTGDLMTVMRWAGHANIETTMRYLASVPQSHREAIEAVEFP